MMRKNIFLITFFLISFGVLSPLPIKRFAVVTIPKCGTHLLIKIMMMLSKSPIRYATGPGGWALITEESIKDLFIKPIILKTHAIHIQENCEKINRDDIKTCFIYRDPRDQIVSAAFWIQKTQYEWPEHSQWPLEKLITELISGGGQIWGTIFSSKETWPNLQGITGFYNLYLPWQFEPYIYTTTFEKLIGPQGGGNSEDQVNEIMAIAQHMGNPIIRSHALNLAKNLFGSTMTFREGKIGSWKKHFTEEHKEMFKTFNNGAGQKLLELLGYEKDPNW